MFLISNCPKIKILSPEKKWYFQENAGKPTIIPEGISIRLISGQTKAK